MMATLNIVIYTISAMGIFLSSLGILYKKALYISKPFLVLIYVYLAVFISALIYMATEDGFIQL